MTIQELGSIGEFISSIAVLFTLIYLAVQVRQTRDATIASTMLNNRLQFQDIMLANRDSMTSPIIPKADAGETLTDEEGYRLSNHISLQWNLLFSEFVPLQIGYTAKWAPSDKAALVQYLPLTVDAPPQRVCRPCREHPKTNLCVLRLLCA
jgi:hypothetical protein